MGAVVLTAADGSNLNGVVGGGQAGYNWQTQNWVLGLEADIQGTDEKDSRAFTYTTPPIAGIAIIPGVTIPFALNQKIDWFGTFLGRAGVLVSPKILVYVTGGLAYGKVDSSETIAALAGLSTSSTNVGWTVGAGIEGVVAGNWTAKLEYLYVDLGRVSGSFAVPGFALTSNYSSHVPTACCGSA